MSFSRFPRQLLWPVAIAALIFAASSRSRVAGPEIDNIDKVAHFLVFGLLATLLCRLRQGWPGAWWAFVGASLYGVTDEWHQMFVPGRGPDVLDWVADTLGAALAVTLYAGWPGYRRVLEMPLGRKRRVDRE